jgi:hypothetical protein
MCMKESSGSAGGRVVESTCTPRASATRSVCVCVCVGVGVRERERGGKYVYSRGRVL